MTNIYLGYLERRNALAYREHIEHVIEQLQQYQYKKVTVDHENPYTDQVWPAKLDNLMSDYNSQFWPMCSKADEKNRLCQRPDGMPWSTAPVKYAVHYVGTPKIAKVTLTFTFPPSVTNEDRVPWAITPSSPQFRVCSPR